MFNCAPFLPLVTTMLLWSCPRLAETVGRAWKPTPERFGVKRPQAISAAYPEAPYPAGIRCNP